MKKFKVVMKSTIIDGEINFRDYDEAEAYFFEVVKGGSYSKVYLIDNETGKCYRTYEINAVDGGVEVKVWYTL